MARWVKLAVPPGVACNKARPPQEECRDKKLEEQEPGSSVSQSAEADCCSRKPLVEALDSAEVVAGGEDGVLGFRVLDFLTLQDTSEGALMQSCFLTWRLRVPVLSPGPSLVSQTGVTAKGGDTSISVEEVEVSSPVECTGGREQVVPLLSDYLVGDGCPTSVLNLGDEVEVDDSLPQLSC